MRLLWSQVPRPRLAGLSISNSPTAIGDSVTTTTVRVLARRNGTAPVRRRLTFNDAFTLLLTPVFGTAFVIDTSWKDKQRKEWDQKLADVNHEIEELHARARRFSSYPQQSSPCNNAGTHQRRAYSTVTQSVALDEDLDEVEDAHTVDKVYAADEAHGFNKTPGIDEVHAIDDAHPIDEAHEIDEAEKEDENFQALRRSSQQKADEPALHYAASSKDYSPEELAQAFQYHRLIASLLAIRLMIHLHAAAPPRYTSRDDDSIVGDQPALPAESSTFNVDIDSLFQFNRSTRAELIRLRRLSLDLRGMGYKIEEMARGQPLEIQLLELFQRFKNQDFDLPSLVRQYTELLAENPTAVPSRKVYADMLNCLRQAGHKTLAYYAASALKHSKLPLSDVAISGIITLCGRTRDGLLLDELLRRIVSADELATFNVIEPWETVHVGGVSIQVPKNRNPRLLHDLIYTAVRTNQLKRAETWASFLHPKDVNVFVLAQAYLQYYSVNMNWEEGKLWIAKCLRYVTTSASDTGVAIFKYIILRILDLCVACGRTSEYKSILETAVDVGFSPPKSPVYGLASYDPRIRAILFEWEELSYPPQKPSTNLEKIQQFQRSCISMVKNWHISEPTQEGQNKSQQKVAYIPMQPSRAKSSLIDPAASVSQYGKFQAETNLKSQWVTETNKIKRFKAELSKAEASVTKIELLFAKQQVPEPVVQSLPDPNCDSHAGGAQSGSSDLQEGIHASFSETSTKDASTGQLIRRCMGRVKNSPTRQAHVQPISPSVRHVPIPTTDLNQGFETVTNGTVVESSAVTEKPAEDNPAVQTAAPKHTLSNLGLARQFKDVPNKPVVEPTGIVQKPVDDSIVVRTVLSQRTTVVQKPVEASTGFRTVLLKVTKESRGRRHNRTTVPRRNQSEPQKVVPSSLSVSTSVDQGIKAEPCSAISRPKIETLTTSRETISRPSVSELLFSNQVSLTGDTGAKFDMLDSVKKPITDSDEVKNSSPLTASTKRESREKSRARQLKLRTEDSLRVRLVTSSQLTLNSTAVHRFDLSNIGKAIGDGHQDEVQASSEAESDIVPITKHVVK